MYESRIPVTAEFTDDRVLGGRILLRQPAKGYRAGLDAALLAAACDARPGDLVADVGCGVGAVALTAACRRPGARFVGLERDDVVFNLAQSNTAANGLQERVEVWPVDVFEQDADRALSFDGVLCNPPFFDDPKTQRAPHHERRGAHLTERELKTWIASLLRLARDGGTITLIHRADRLADILALLGPKAGSFQVRPVQPFADQPAGRVLVRAVRGGKAPLRLLPPLVLHARDGAKHTNETDAILRGEADLKWL